MELVTDYENPLKNAKLSQFESFFKFKLYFIRHILSYVEVFQSYKKSCYYFFFNIYYLMILFVP